MAFDPASDTMSSSPVLIAVAKRSALAYAALFVGLALVWSPPDNIAALIGAPFLFLWCLGPTIVANVMVKAARTRGGQWTFLLAEAAVFVSMGWAIVHTIFINQDPKAGFYIPYFAFLQYCGIAVFAILAILCGWRARDEWR